MPFGQVHSVATFQRLMKTMLGELLFKEWLMYVDDIIVYSSLIDELKLKPEKCGFFQTEVSFLGHTVTPNGVMKDDKNQAIKEWAVPKNVKELRRFLGLTGYQRKYLSHYAQWVNPLSDLLNGYSNKRGNRSENRKTEEELWKWGLAENNSFQMLKKEVCKQIELSYADFENFVQNIH